ncbi:D5 family helicase-primase [Bodo saltans virus]|uniref:D5 family helicase-primase n=1 Tax=Bodo saltans virus TaxID=2024608 RepID=A0A2H4UVC8_9VIRU|nr:D5 family helicase-primase [Bodo saltans virus]ATZ80785.1 D5 family helicase-primase [Bodo saltans virus]
MENIKDIIKEYIDKKLVIFSIDVKHKKNKNGIWKKDITFPPKWTEFTFKKTYFNEKYNGLALLTGKINNIIIVDIDNIDHWNNLLKENDEKEPKTVKAMSGSGGMHLYFKYTDELENITSSDHKFGKDYDIDLKTNGGCIISPPTTYYNNNMNKNVSYTWVRSIFEYDPLEIPVWIKHLLLEQKKEKDKHNKIENSDKHNKIENSDKHNKIENSDKQEKKDKDTDSYEFDIGDFTEDEIVQLVLMLSAKRAEGYSDWLNVGMCLYNLNSEYRLIWKEFSKKSKKYDEKENTDKWKTFRKNKNGLKVGSLLKWAKEDNPVEYDKFMSNRNLQKMIVAKYPNDNLNFGSVINVSDVCKYIGLKNDNCFIKGSPHTDGIPSSNYIEITKNCISLKCNHLECFGKLYCNHMNMTKQETNLVFNGNVYNININNNSNDELIEFQKINLFDDEKLNELVYEGLNGKEIELAAVFYYNNENNYIYGEDSNWYMFENHIWKKTNDKNSILRDSIKPQLVDIYNKVYDYYYEHTNDKKRMCAIKQLIKNFGSIVLKNSIVTELADLYYVNKNKNGDFLEKLNANCDLLGFTNGVFDLSTFEFRNGKPDDFITMTTKYDYIDAHTEKYSELLQFLKDVLPDDEEREYILTYLSIGLIGNKLELFTILTGCGRNGKSKLIELLSETFGDYFGSVQSQLFTRPRPDANSPDPGLLSLQRKRIVIASEPEKNSRLNSGFIKFITGRDSTTLRNCHSNDMVKFTANFITLLICNDIPDCDDIDNAFSKRLRCINFPTEFVNEPTNENQKKINVNINKNFVYWKKDFMLLLIAHYKKYVTVNKLNPTKNILKWTNQYKEDTDMYLQFLNSCTEPCDTHIHCSELYEVFKTWFKNNNPQSKIPSNKEFVANLRKHKDICKVLANGKSQIGVKNLKLID